VEHDQLAAPAHGHVLHGVRELTVRWSGSGQPGTVGKSWRRRQRRPGFERGTGTLGAARADSGTPNPATAVAAAVTGDERGVSACPVKAIRPPADPAPADPQAAIPAA
jgi:hypothetical protein